MGFLMDQAIKAAPKARTKWKEASNSKKLDFVRLLLSGGIAGMALVGTILWFAGLDQSHGWDLVGIATGATAATSLKIAHLA